MDKLPKGKPRLLIKALLQMTMETDEATDRNSAPTTPNWKLDISPIYDKMMKRMKNRIYLPKVKTSHYQFQLNSSMTLVA